LESIRPWNPSGAVFDKKTGFFRRFSEEKSHHAGYFGVKSFPKELISKELKIICKVFREIYTPWGYRGERLSVFVKWKQGFGASRV
jgi:hypothetical protein